jgi:hypothetical protein
VTHQVRRNFHQTGDGVLKVGQRVPDQELAAPGVEGRCTKIPSSLPSEPPRSGPTVMARIFISHSSANNAEALALRDWLVARGWDDLFLDIDPQLGRPKGPGGAAGASHVSSTLETGRCSRWSHLRLAPGSRRSPRGSRIPPKIALGGDLFLDTEAQDPCADLAFAEEASLAPPAAGLADVLRPTLTGRDTPARRSVAPWRR